MSKPEVEHFAVSGYLEERTCFGNNIFYYALQVKNTGAELSADFDGTKITVFIPEEKSKGWPSNNIIGFDAAIQVNEDEQLLIIVEKDFKCLEDAVDDQADNYENPKASC